MNSENRYRVAGRLECLVRPVRLLGHCLWRRLCLQVEDDLADLLRGNIGLLGLRVDGVSEVALELGCERDLKGGADSFGMEPLPKAINRQCIATPGLLPSPSEAVRRRLQTRLLQRLVSRPTASRSQIMHQTAPVRVIVR